METDWTCKRCHHQSATKGNLVSHLNRKTPCDAKFTLISIDAYIKELTTKVFTGKVYECSHCKAQFSTRQAKFKHKSYCKVIKNGEASTSGASTSEASTSGASTSASTSASVNIANVTQEDKIASLEAENAILKQRLDRVEQCIVMGNIHVGNTNTQINNNTSININVNTRDFGQEDISYLTPDFLRYCLLNPRKGMSSLIETIHYNKEYPDNHNLRCKSLKQNIFEKYVDSEWRVCDASNTLDELIRKGYRILNAHYTETIMNDPAINEDENTQKIYEKFRFLGDTNCNDYFAVKRDLRLVVKDRTVYLLASPETDITQAIENDDTNQTNIESL